MTGPLSDQSTGTAPRAGGFGFLRHLRVEVVPGDAVYVFGERVLTTLSGADVQVLAPLLDGSRDLPALCAAVTGRLSAEQVRHLVDRLVAAHLVGQLEPPAGATPDPAWSAYWDALGTTPPAPAAEVALIRLDSVDGTATLDALRAAGLRVRPVPAGQPPNGDELVVVLCDDYLCAGLDRVDAVHRLAGRPWLLAKPTGTQPWLGPVFRPGGPCWHCLAVRLRGNRPAESRLQQLLGRDGPIPRPPATIPPLASAAAQLIALATAQWLAGHRHAGQESVWTLNSADLATQYHQVRRRPQCARCGDPDLVRRQAYRPVVLSNRRAAANAQGARRAVPPERVLADYGHLVSPITGLVKEIRRDPRGPALFNSFGSGPNPALRGRNMAGLRSALRAGSGGKGVTALDAEVSALCEALERYCGHAQDDEAVIRESYRQLDDEAIHPDACQLYDPRQFADRVAWNAAHGPFQHVCEPFDETLVRDWTPVWSLSQQRHRLLPTALLYYGGRPGPGTDQLRADSNGNAAGASLEDAVLHGLLELVERDAVAIWWYNRTQQRGIDIEAFRDGWVTAAHAAHAELNRELWVLDVTSDLGVPTMAAVSRRRTEQGQDIMLSFGAHPDPGVALRRCVTELNQLMPAVLEAPGEAHRGQSDPDAARWWREATVANQPYLLPDTAVAPAGPADYAYCPSDDITDDIDALHTTLRSRGLELLVLDQTRPDVGLPVVKVIVPGLRGFWARFAPGRLFDVPVRLGRLAEPTPYRELNPFPIFL